jgi:hypothetical protein
MPRCLAALLLGLVWLPPAARGAGPPDSADRVLEAALAAERASYDRLAWLTDRIGPRLSGSAGLENAVRWATARMEADGLDRVWTEEVMVPRWVRGRESGAIVAPVERPLAIVALGGSVGTPEGGVTAEVIEVASFEELRDAGERVRGKVVLYNRPILPESREHGYGSAVGLRSRGAREAAKQGAVATLLRSLGTADFRLPHTGAMGYGEDNVPRIPAAAVAAEDAELIHRLLASGDPVRVRLDLGCETLPDVPSANVLADLRGRERPEEIVLIGAHLDSWDVGTGAIDDGAGVVIVMETMRLLRALDLRPRRTIRAVLFTNEENGLRGGIDYARRHAAESHVAAVETDSGGAAPRGFGVTAGPGGLERVAAVAARLSAIGAEEVTAGGGGADIGPLRRAGVPVLGLRQDTTHYFDYHHTNADTLDKVKPADLARNVAAMALLAWSLAEMPEPLPRPEPE